MMKASVRHANHLHFKWCRNQAFMDGPIRWGGCYPSPVYAARAGIQSMGAGPSAFRGSVSFARLHVVVQRLRTAPTNNGNPSRVTSA